jgi:hypothetical protein
MMTFLPYIGLFGPVCLCIAGNFGVLLVKRFTPSRDTAAFYERKITQASGTIRSKTEPA